jgi:uncharacterized protein (UPF0305 family)
MIMIDDTSRYCYVYLLKTKDEALNCFKTYKAEVENQLEKKIKRLTCSVWNMILYMRGRHPIHPNQTRLPKERITH